jgi:hypothetical protein
MILEVTDFISACFDSAVWAARYRLIRSRLCRRKPQRLVSHERRPKQQLDTISCSGCRFKAMMSFDDARNSYHLTCVNPNCPDPKWTDPFKKNRDLRATLREWLEVNNISTN